MHQSLSVFSEACDSMNYIFPNLPSMIQPVPASSLRVISLDNLPEAGPPPSKGGHFFTINLDTFKKFPLDKEILIRQYRCMLERTIDDVQFL